MGITTIDEIETPGDQSHGVDSVSILYKSEHNVLDHVCICFDSCRRSATEDNAQVHSFLAIKDCVATVGLLSDLILLFLL